MKVAAIIPVLILATSISFGQSPPAPPPPPPPPVPQKVELGKWWKNSAVVREVGLKDSQIEQIEQIFLGHRAKLESLQANLKQAEEKFKPIVNADKPDEVKVKAQLDQVLAARNELERENTMMMLAIRGTMATDQWKRLQEIQERRFVPPPPPPTPAPPAAPAPPVPPAADKVYRIGDGVHPPTVLYQPRPPYTQEARDAKVEGLMLLQCIIRKDGSVGNVKILRGLGHGLDASAINTLRSRWKFTPGTINGLPVDVMANVEVSFRLK